MVHLNYTWLKMGDGHFLIIVILSTHRQTLSKVLPSPMDHSHMPCTRTDVETYGGLEELPLATMEVQLAISLRIIPSLVILQKTSLAST